MWVVVYYIVYNMPGNWKNQFSDDVGVEEATTKKYREEEWVGKKESVENVLENFCILCRNEKCF